MMGLIFFIIISQSMEEKGSLYIKLADYKNALITYSELVNRDPDNEKIREKLVYSAEKYIEQNSEKLDKSLFEKAISKYNSGELDSALYLSKTLYDRFYFYPEAMNLYQKYIWTLDTLKKLYSVLKKAEGSRDYSTAYKVCLNIKEVYPYYPDIDEKIEYYYKKIPKIIKKPVTVKKKKPVKRVTKKKVEKKEEKLEDIKAKIQELYKRGITLYSEGRLEEARNVFREILRLDPQNTKVRRNLAVIEERLRRKR